MCEKTLNVTSFCSLGVAGLDKRGWMKMERSSLENRFEWAFYLIAE